MYKVEVSNEGAYRFNVKSKAAGFAVDLNGGGITPPDVLLASLGSCVGVYVRKYAEGAKLALSDFTINVEADLGKQAPYYFREIKVSIDLKSAALDERRKKAIIEFVKNCPIHNTLKNNPDINVSII